MSAPLDIAALRALEKAATPGPWIARVQHPDMADISASQLWVGELGHGKYLGEIHSRDRGRPSSVDADFIAAARNALPDLLSALGEAAGLLEHTRNLFGGPWAEKRDALLKRLGRGGGE